LNSLEIQISQQGTLEVLWDKMDVILHIAAFGFSAAIFVMIISAAWRLGWRLWPWVLGLGFLAYLFI